MRDSGALADRLVAAQLRETSGLVEEARSARYRDFNALDFATSAVLLLNGATTEHHPYALPAESHAKAGAAALKTVRNLVATGIVRHVPRAEGLVARHPAFVQKLGHGPLARRPAEARTIRLVSKLLLDSIEFERLHRRGYFTWDDGSAQLAMCIDYAWRHAADPTAWLTQKPRQLRLDAQAVTRRVFLENRHDPFARTVELRYRQTWYALTESTRNEQERDLRLIISSAPPALSGTTVLAVFSLLDLGFRTEQPHVITDAVARLAEQRPDLNGHPSLIVPEAWAHVYAGRLDDAAASTAAILRSRAPGIRSQAIPLLKRLGHTAQASKLQTQMAIEQKDT